MQTQRIVDGAPPPQSMLVTTPVLAQRSARRATARRASNRRATARQHKGHIDGRKGHIDGRILKDHPQSTTGDMAKRPNANRDAIAAEVSHMVRVGKITEELGGQVASADAPSTE